MSKSIKVNTGISLSKLIQKVIVETQRSQLENNGIDERMKQQQALDEEDDDTDLDLGGEDKSSATLSGEMEKLKKGNVTTDDIIQKMNSIRAGKSFKDESVASKLDEYVESLTKAEKVALLAFLKGLSQIVTGEIPPEDAVDPSDEDPDVTMKKGGTEKKITVKPTIVKKPTAGTKRSSGEDTSGPVPIKPKK